MSDLDQALDRSAFQHALDILSERDGFMAFIFRIAFGGDVSAGRIARELNCSEDAAIRLAMMRAPATDQDGFRRDLALMAKDVGIDSVALAGTIRQARALSTFDAPRTDAILMAARDRINDVDPEE